MILLAGFGLKERFTSGPFYCEINPHTPAKGLSLAQI